MRFDGNGRNLRQEAGVQGVLDRIAEQDGPGGRPYPRGAPTSRMTFWIATSSADTSCSTLASVKM